MKNGAVKQHQIIGQHILSTAVILLLFATLMHANRNECKPCGEF